MAVVIAPRGGICVTCLTALGSAETSIPGVRRGREGPNHRACATEAEIRVHEQKMRASANGHRSHSPDLLEQFPALGHI